MANTFLYRILDETESCTDLTFNQEQLYIPNTKVGHKNFDFLTGFTEILQNIYIYAKNSIL
jgi:hypothetical protein